MGIPTYWSSPELLSQTTSITAVAAEAISWKLFSIPGSVLPPPSPAVTLAENGIQQVHYRVDPPVDFNYLETLEKITQRMRSPRDPRGDLRVFSPPQLLRNQSEKIVPAELQFFAPRSIVIDSEPRARDAHREVRRWGRMVTKPLNQAQSKGVKQHTTPLSQATWIQLCRSESQDFQTPFLAQEFLPQVHEGEVRMWFADGVFIAALKKFPLQGDFRVLVDQGSRLEAYHLNSAEKTAAQAVGKVLKKQGVRLAAIDWIAGKISDYNITSPGLLVQLEKLHQENYAQKVLQILQASNGNPSN